MWIPLVILLLGLAAALALASLFARRRRRLIGTAVVVGYLAGGSFAWLMLPRAWPLSFPQTLAASVDAATYGHPVEHYSQGVVWMILVAGLVGASICGAAGNLWGRRFRLPGD